MIYATVNVTIGDYQSTCDNTIVLYRGDKNVEIRFVLKGNKFTVLNSIYAQMIITRPSTTSVFSEIAPIQNDTVILTISEDMIDELTEVGCYDMQIRLYDDSMKSRVTIPPAEKAIEVREPIAIDESFVDTAMVGYARVQTDSEDEEDKRFDENGNYIKTYWEHGDIITAGKLNKVEDSLEAINANDIQNHIDVNEKIDALAESINAAEYVTETELNAKGYLTEHQDISGKADKTELHNHSNKSVLDGITASKVSSWDNKSNFDGNYNSLTNKPSIPSIEGLATENYVDGKVAGISVDIDYESVLKFDTEAMIDYTIAIVGEVDENNIITLWSNVLSDGLYTLRYSNGYEYADIGTVFIGELMLTKIEATKVLTTYSEGDTLNTDDIIVKVFYNDGTSKNISDYTLDISSIKMDTPGNYQLIITYENMSTNIAIKVQEKATIKGNLFVPSTCTIGKRINSSGLEKDQTGTFVTDFIEIGECMSNESENIIHWQGFHLYKVTASDLTEAGMTDNSPGGTYKGVAYYDTTGTYLGQDTLYVTAKVYDSEGNYQLVLNSSYTTASKIRVWGTTLPPATSINDLQNCKLTLNQLISEI